MASLITSRGAKVLKYFFVTHVYYKFLGNCSYIQKPCLLNPKSNLSILIKILSPNKIPNSKSQYKVHYQIPISNPIKITHPYLALKSQILILNPNTQWKSKILIQNTKPLSQCRVRAVVTILNLNPLSKCVIPTQNLLSQSPITMPILKPNI